MRAAVGYADDCLGAFKRVTGLASSRVSAPLLDHRAAPPQATGGAPKCTLAGGPVFGGLIQ